MPGEAWFEALFGFREGNSYAKNRAAFKLSPDGFLICESAPEQSKRMYVGPFETPSLCELRERSKSCASGGDGLRFRHLADPVGVAALIADPANAGAIFMAASQFNCLGE